VPGPESGAADQTGRGERAREPQNVKDDTAAQHTSGHDSDVSRYPCRTEGVTTIAVDPRTRAETKAGLGTVDDVRLASRQLRSAGRLTPTSSYDRVVANSIVRSKDRHVSKEIVRPIAAKRGQRLRT
jgi:hypothetical protein